MPYLIDGHNLIGQLPTISLSDPDDEAKLVRLLQRYAMRHRVKLTVFFDHGSYGQAPLGGNGVSVVFARSPEDADRRLVKQMRRLVRPHDWTLISADAALVRVAREIGLQVIHGADFANRLLDLDAAPAPDVERAEAHAHVKGGELDSWLELFGVDAQEAARPVNLVSPPRAAKQRGQRKPAPGRPPLPAQQPPAADKEAQGEAAAPRRGPTPRDASGNPLARRGGPRPLDEQGRPLIKPPPPVHPDEIAEWLRLFGEEDEEEA